MIKIKGQTLKGERPGVRFGPVTFRTTTCVGFFPVEVLLACNLERTEVSRSKKLILESPSGMRNSSIKCEPDIHYSEDKNADKRLA